MTDFIDDFYNTKKYNVVKTLVAKKSITPEFFGRVREKKYDVVIFGKRSRNKNYNAAKK